MQAFTPIVTMLALFVAGLEVPNRRLISSVVLIAVGTAIASYGEINLSLIGVIFMLLSESFEATRLVMTQILLVGLKFHPSKAVFLRTDMCHGRSRGGYPQLESETGVWYDQESMEFPAPYIAGTWNVSLSLKYLLVT